MPQAVPPAPADCTDLRPSPGCIIAFRSLIPYGTFGKPRQVPSDLGTESCSVLGGKGRSKPDRLRKVAGIEHIYSGVRRPRTNGMMGRIHRSAKEEVPYFGGPGSLEKACRTFSKWLDCCNAHVSIGHLTTAARPMYISGCCLYGDPMDIRGHLHGVRLRFLGTDSGDGIIDREVCNRSHGVRVYQKSEH